MNRSTYDQERDDPMKKFALALAALALLLALAAPADAALARRAQVFVAPPAAQVNALALFEATRETLARLLFVDFAERLSTIERLFDCPEAPTPIDLEKTADDLRRG
jgi:hypothetical protein